MALDLGTLRGYIDLDSGKWDATFAKTEETLKKFGAKAPKWMSGATTAIAAGGLIAAGLLGAAIVKGVSQSLDMEAVRAKLTAELGLSVDDAERLGKAAGRIYASGWGESVDDISSAISAIISSIDGMKDANDETIDAMTTKALAFGKTFEIDVSRSTQVVGQLLKTGLVRDADEGFDLLTATMQKVPKAVREDIMDAADEYGPFFASIGLDGESAFNLLASSAEKGMYGIDKTGDAIKEFMIRATDLNDSGAQEAFETLGISGKDAANDLLAGGDTAKAAMEKITKALSSIEDPAQQAAAATALFGTPLEDLGKDSIPGFLEALAGAPSVLGDVEGASDKMTDALETTGMGWESISRTWGQIIGQVGQALLPVLSGLADFLKDNPIVLEIVAAAIGVLAVAFIALTVATWAMNTALLANPLTWIILGVLALIAAVILLVMHWDEVVAWISDVWAGFIGWITDVIDGFIGWWTGVWEGFVGFLTDVWDGLVGFIEDVWQGFINWIMGVMIGYLRWWIDIWNGVSTFFSDLWNGIIGFVTDAWGNIMTFLGEIPQKVLDVFAGAGKWLYDIGSDILQGLWDGLLSIWNGLVGWIGDIGESIADTFAAVLGIQSPSTVFRDFGINTMQGYMMGLDKLTPDLDKQMGDLVRTPEMQLVGAGKSASPAPVSSSSKTIVYQAAENQSLSSEEALFAALGSPRVKD